VLGIKNYTLAICEKSDAARKIAKAIATDDYREVWVDGIQVYVARGKGKTFVVCYALGHLYTLEDPVGNRHVYPVFEIEWVPVEKRFKIKRIIEVIGKLAKDASEFVNACDFDQEGEVIGYNILKYACDNKHERAYRARFSTLTEEELRSAFGSMQRGTGIGLADAGRARHVLDFIYGVNLSRALSESVYRSSKRFSNLTVGRVQGPTLSFVVEREKEIRTHVPVPYWQINAKFEKDDQIFNASYEKDRIMKLAEAKKIVSACKGKDGKVTDIKHEKAVQKPPTPFNLGDLQREAYRLFRFTPSFTLSVAERLYLDALISYPRTSSQKLPRSIDYRRIIRNLGRIGVYASLSSSLLRLKLIPNEGSKDDPAHPAIYPTGEVPKRKLERTEWKVYDLIVKRFFATFGDPVVRENTDVIIEVSGYNFIAKGRTTTDLGWTFYYKPYANLADIELPQMQVNDTVRNLGIRSTEKYTQPSPRFNQASLVEKMEREEIGTKATRAEIVRTLIERGYVTVDIEATDLGFAVVEMMQNYMPDIIGTELTRTMEKQLEDVERNKLEDKEVIGEAIEVLKKSLDRFKAKESEVGREMSDVIARTDVTQKQVGSCLLCKDGVLKIITSRKSGKRFIGCSNYEKGCKASMPLPQRGIIRAIKKSCGECKWPVVSVRSKTRYTWKMCVNINCPTKRKHSN
jgi:DNA topoisomerase-1